jgi:arsenical pump membrane protein
VTHKHWRLWVWPFAGAVVLILARLEPLGAAAAAIARQWNVMLFIAGLLGLSAAAEASGAFQWITDALLVRADGSLRRLFTLLFLVGAVVTIVLSNDATAIVLTPIVYRAVAKRGVDASPFLYACVFVANTASFGLPFSNPTNVLILPHPQLLDYVWHLAPPQIAAIAINWAVFLFFFRRSLSGGYDVPAPAVPSARALRTLVIMAGVAVAYVVGLRLAWPLGPIALVGGAVALAIAGMTLPQIGRRISWSTFALLAGLFAIFDALTRAGLVTWLVRGLDGVTRYGTLAVDAAAAAGSALLSNVFNNLPIAVASSYVVARAPSTHLGYPLIVGVDVGPNLAVTGSLATILWLTILRGYGVRVSFLEYLRLGVLVVPPVLAVTVLWLAVVR